MKPGVKAAAPSPVPAKVGTSAGKPPSPGSAGHSKAMQFTPPKTKSTPAVSAVKESRAPSNVPPKVQPEHTGPIGGGGKTHVGGRSRMADEECDTMPKSDLKHVDARYMGEKDEADAGDGGEAKPSPMSQLFNECYKNRMSEDEDKGFRTDASGDGDIEEAHEDYETTDDDDRPSLKNVIRHRKNHLASKMRYKDGGDGTTEDEMNDPLYDSAAAHDNGPDPQNHGDQYSSVETHIKNGECEPVDKNCNDEKGRNSLVGLAKGATAGVKAATTGINTVSDKLEKHNEKTKSESQRRGELASSSSMS